MEGFLTFDLALPGYIYIFILSFVFAPSLSDTFISSDLALPRYLAEFATGNDRKEAAENSLVAYKVYTQPVIICYKESVTKIVRHNDFDYKKRSDFS